MKTIFTFIMLCCMLTAANMNAQDSEKLFRANCGACHTVGKGKLVGPDLKDSHKKYEEEWLIKWIKSSQTLVKKGDPTAVKLFEENNKLVMPDPAVTEDEIRTIIAYIREASEKPAEIASEQPKNATAVPEPKPEAYDYHRKDSAPLSWKAATFVLAGFCVILVIIVIALANAVGSVAREAAEQRFKNTNQAQL